MDDGNYKKDRHDGLKHTSENYKSYFDTKSPVNDKYGMGSPSPRRGHTTLDVRNPSMSEEHTFDHAENT